VLQLRLVVEAEDYEAAVRFYRDVLGLRQEAAYEGGDDAQVTILDAGRATLEIAGGATLVAPPTVTPWQSRNARFDAPAGLHITLFQELAE
jgi:catechol 2,3-dioxygenase-like lactoylglutathione lyase family enzyme